MIVGVYFQSVSLTGIERQVEIYLDNVGAAGKCGFLKQVEAIPQVSDSQKQRSTTPKFAIGAKHYHGHLFGCHVVYLETENGSKGSSLTG